jgi:hypothetical protein
MPKSLGLATKVVGAGTRLRARAGRGPRRESALKASVLFGGEGRTFGISGNPLMDGYKKRVAATPAPNWSRRSLPSLLRGRAKIIGTLNAT